MAVEETDISSHLEANDEDCKDRCEPLLHRSKEIPISPSCKRKLWMKTPFSSFSSDSTACSLGANTKNLEVLRLQLRQVNIPGNVPESPTEAYLKSMPWLDVSHRASRKNTLKGPLRVIRLCILSIIFPGLLIGVPLYMRYYVYSDQVYPVGMSDMRLMDAKISTTWCQSQTVWSNATFNAYLMENDPRIEDREHVSMTRYLSLKDDMKEYWGFYLLKGSVITVSSCARWPGASMILIRGHKYLHECAYIGDDSSEELDELNQEVDDDDDDDDPPNSPSNMTKLVDGVIKVNNKVNTSVIHGHHRRRLTPGTSESNSHDERVNGYQKVSYKIGNTVHLAYAQHGENLVKKDPNIEIGRLRSMDKKIDPSRRKVATDKSAIKNNVSDRPESKSSKEIYNDLLNKLQQLGGKGKAMLQQLNTELLNSTEKRDIAGSKPVEQEFKIRHSRRHIKHRLNDETESNQEIEKRRKRSTVILGSLNQHDEEGDVAMEEGIHNPDEIADIRGTFNETTSYDKSKSEFWSSFSSSEERLINCDGVLLNLPLKPHRYCEAKHSEDKLKGASDYSNMITYRVSKNGYYFFVFNSENEVQTNFLRVHFDLEKTKYNVSTPVQSCTNQTSICSLPLTFWSEEKVVFQLPVRSNDTLWNQEFLVVSTCEPRTSIYVVCVISVPLFIMLFAFQ